jgi:hypothetical protein
MSQHQLIPYDGLKEPCEKCSRWMGLGSSARPRGRGRRGVVSVNESVSKSGRCGLIDGNKSIHHRKATYLEWNHDASEGWYQAVGMTVSRGGSRYLSKERNPYPA